jgi:hypothetical protein
MPTSQKLSSSANPPCFFDSIINLFVYVLVYGSNEKDRELSGDFKTQEIGFENIFFHTTIHRKQKLEKWLSGMDHQVLTFDEIK